MKMLYSIDVKVGRVIVIDNSGTNWELTTNPPHLPQIEYIRPASPLGYGGGINAGIVQSAEADWWMWASNDIVWEAGFLKTVIEKMNTNPFQDPILVTGGFVWGALNHEVIEKVGLIDEWSFYPIYYDDNDYLYRCKLAGVKQYDVWGITHGDGKHKGSMAINSSEELKQSNHKSFRENKNNYILKWGGEPGQERFVTPWATGYPLWYVKPDMKARARRMW